MYLNAIDFKSYTTIIRTLGIKSGNVFLSDGNVAILADNVAIFNLQKPKHSKFLKLTIQDFLFIAEHAESNFEIVGANLVIHKNGKITIPIYMIDIDVSHLILNEKVKYKLKVTNIKKHLTNIQSCILESLAYLFVFEGIAISTDTYLMYASSIESNLDKRIALPKEALLLADNGELLFGVEDGVAFIQKGDIYCKFPSPVTLEERKQELLLSILDAERERLCILDASQESDNIEEIIKNLKNCTEKVLLKVENNKIWFEFKFGNYKAQQSIDVNFGVYMEFWADPKHLMKIFGGCIDYKEVNISYNKNTIHFSYDGNAEIVKVGKQ